MIFVTQLRSYVCYVIVKNSLCPCICIIWFVFFSSCQTSTTSQTELTFRGGVYLRKDELYSGKVYTKFNDGRTSGYVTLEEGIPNGKWRAFGYDNELIQEGEYIPIENRILEQGANYIRLTLVKGKEGTNATTDLYVVTNTSNVNSIDTSLIRISMLSKHITFDHMVIVDREL